MSKKTLTVLVLSVIAVLVWIGYSVYENIYGANYANEMNAYNIDQYSQPVSTNMNLGILKEVNALSGNIQVTDQELSN